MFRTRTDWYLHMAQKGATMHSKIYYTVNMSKTTSGYKNGVAMHEEVELYGDNCFQHLNPKKAFKISYCTGSHKACAATIYILDNYILPLYT